MPKQVAVTAVLRADHFEFRLEFEKVNAGTSELTSSGDVWATLKLAKPRNVEFETETYLRGDQLHVMRSIIRDTLKLNGSIVPCTGEYSPDGLGFKIEITAAKQYHGDPRRLPDVGNRMPCSCGVSFAMGPADPELGGFVMVDSYATAAAVQEFLSGLDDAAANVTYSRSRVESSNDSAETKE